mgnify:CR=1 FL=1
MTNNSSKNAEIYVEKLHKMGLDIDPQKQLITSGHATIDYLKRNFPEKSVYLFGNKALMDEFEKNGICLEEDHPDVLISAFDTSFNYTKLCKFCDLVREAFHTLVHIQIITVQPKMDLSQILEPFMPM